MRKIGAKRNVKQKFTGVVLASIVEKNEKVRH